MNRDKLVGWIKFYADSSDRKYRSPSGADKPDAHRDQLTATALRKVLAGTPVDAAVAWLRAEWFAFMISNNAKVNAAPKMRRGPMSGCSAIHYRYATACSGEQGVTNVLQAVARSSEVPQCSVSSASCS